jgi:hypothetical protein
MRTLFIPSRRQQAATAISGIAGALILAFCLASLGEILDATPTSYASFGYRGEPADTVAHAIASSRAADDVACRDLHGPNATAQQRPDGSHRCVDKRGRALARSAITIPSHELAAR